MLFHHLVGQYAIGQERKRFSLQIPKKDLVGRAVIYHVKGKE